MLAARHTMSLFQFHSFKGEFLLPPVSFLLPPSSCLLPPASFLLPSSSCLLPSSSCLLPPASCLLPPASCLLPPASCLLPPASCLLNCLILVLTKVGKDTLKTKVRLNILTCTKSPKVTKITGCSTHKSRNNLLNL